MRKYHSPGALDKTSLYHYPEHCRERQNDMEMISGMLSWPDTERII
jgi:hypothetical protein